jgi:hypothetical protein
MPPAAQPPDRDHCGHCGALLPADGSGRRYCGRTHKRKAQERRRRREAVQAAAAGCLSKLPFATIEAAVASGYLTGSVCAVRRCLYCPGYHLTRNARSSLVVLVRRPREPAGAPGTQASTKTS